jgi:hypothetical protein
MKLLRAALLTVFFSHAAMAQSPGLGDTRPVPPPSREDPPPALGDSHEPRGPAAEPQTRAEPDPVRMRCEQLTGAERQGCLREERSAAGGATRPADLPTAPPPQNPR